MERLSRNPNVFIRPTATGQALGGVSHHTRETILLCEAAGFDIILIETVGVGQSETQVRGMVDFFLLLLLSGAGDELQGMKKGIMEMADGVIINKADGDNLKAASQARADAQNALHLQSPAASGWTPKVLLVSALENKGIDETWKMILQYHQETNATGYFEGQRSLQKRQWFDECIEQLFRSRIHQPSLLEMKDRLENEVMNRSLLPSAAAQLFWEALINQK
jgi:LAO/AO transport system kinase